MSAPKHSAKDFREALLKIMPGYQWTVHRPGAFWLAATGIQSSGFNRLSTLSVVRRERGGEGGPVEYEAKSAGFGTRAKWLHTNTDATLASALRGLQQHYEAMEAKYGGHARALKNARAATATGEGAS